MHFYYIIWNSFKKIKQNFLNLRLRLAQFDISGTLVGSKSAAVSMDARSAKADPSNLLRKVVVVRLKGKSIKKPSFKEKCDLYSSPLIPSIHVMQLFTDMTASNLDTLVSHGVGAIVLLLPNESEILSSNEQKESLLQLEEHMLASEIEIPIYFAEDSEQANQLIDDLDLTTGQAGQKTSAAQGL